MTPKVLALHKKRVSDVLVLYTLVVDFPEGNTIECHIDAEYVDIGEDIITVLNPHIKVWEDFQEYELPDNPGLYNPVVQQLLKVVSSEIVGQPVPLPHILTPE